jgi:DNA topoisomerase-6 subunit B
MPKEVVEIDPHPHGMELGTLQRMLRETDENDMLSFLTKSFSSVPEGAAKRILEKADLDKSRQPRRIKSHDAQALVDCFLKEKLVAPPLNCLSPIEDLLIKKGLSKAIDSRFASTITRKPLVSQGNPYQIEVGLVFGGDLNSDSPIEILRFANRVPLMYQQGGCMLTKAIESVDWKRYGLEQPGGRGIPKGPAALLIHLASTNVQFTSEAKEAVAVNEEIMDEIRRALLKVGQGLRGHLKKSTQRKKAQEKFELVNVILPEISKKSSQILGREEPDLAPVITKIMNAVFCEEEVGWDIERKLATCDITVFNYTARARAYTILAKWPEGDGVEMVYNPLGGRKEAHGLWAWRLDTLDPGSSATISFCLSGLGRGNWNETEIFFRGNGDIVGANKIDEKLLEDMRKQEVATEEIKDVEGHEEVVDSALRGVIERKDEAVSESPDLATTQMTLPLGFENKEEAE